MGSVRININNELLLWAIQRAGYEKDQAEKSFPLLSLWMEGMRLPTKKQLEDFAKKFYVPFGYLMLSAPPEESPLIPFFRGNEGSAAGKLNVLDTIHILSLRQGWLRDYLEENEYEKLPFVGRFNNVGEDGLVDAIRELLSLDETWAIQQPNPSAAVSFLSSLIEDKGVAVEFNGVVGNSTTRRIEVADCRGFVLVDAYVPFIFVNNNDSKRAQLFTLIHELTHVLIGYGSGYAGVDMDSAGDSKERLCNRVAAEFLVPRIFFDLYWKDQSDIITISKKSKASTIVVARRAYDLGLLSKDYLNDLYQQPFDSDLPPKKRSSGGDFYRTLDRRLGSVFSTHIGNAVRNGHILYNEAYRLTGLYGKTFNKAFKLENV